VIVRNRRLTLALFGRVREEAVWTARRYGYSHIEISWQDWQGITRVRDHIPREEAIAFRERLDVAIRKAETR